LEKFLENTQKKMKEDSKKGNWHSSYEENNYGDFFYSLVRAYKPKKIVELGTKTGYSAHHMARALRENGRGTLDCYDLWGNHIENYGFKHIAKPVAEENLKEFDQIITLTQRDAVGVHDEYDMVDILHIDLDNNGDILEKIIPVWIDKVSQLIVIEGGSSERDNLDLHLTRKRMPISEWLKNFSKNQINALKKNIPDASDKTGQFVVVAGDIKNNPKPIKKWLENFSARRGDIEYFTMEPFPSLTIIRKK